MSLLSRRRRVVAYLLRLVRYNAGSVEPAIVADFTRGYYAEYQRYAANAINPSIAADFNRDLYRTSVG